MTVDQRIPPRLDFLTKIVAVNWGVNNLLVRLNYGVFCQGKTVPVTNVTGLGSGNVNLWDSKFQSGDKQIQVVDPPSKDMMAHLYAWAIPGQVTQETFPLNGTDAVDGMSNFYFNIGKIMSSFGHGNTTVRLAIVVPQMPEVPEQDVTQFIVFWNHPEETTGWGPFYPRAPVPPAEDPALWIAIFQSDAGMIASPQDVANAAMKSILGAVSPAPILATQVVQGNDSSADEVVISMNTDGGTTSGFGLVSRFGNPAVAGHIELVNPADPPAWGANGALIYRDPKTGTLKQLATAGSFGSGAFLVEITVDTKAKTLTISGPGGDTGGGSGGTGG